MNLRKALSSKRTMREPLRGLLAVLSVIMATTTLPIFESVGLSHPVLLPAKEVPWLVGAKRDHVIAITKDPKTAAWVRVPLQDEEIEDEVAIVFRKPTNSLPVRRKLRKPKEDDPFEGYFDRFHRFVLNAAKLGVCADKSCNKEAKDAATKICEGGGFKSYSRLVRIETTFEKGVGYLADCGKQQKPLAKIDAASDPGKTEFRGPGFAFRYEDRYSVLLDSLHVGDEGKAILDNTEMKISLRPKYMFNLDFDTGDIHAEISSLTHGPVSLAAEIATAFNLTIFQFNKQICCDINIFEDAVYFPVMLDLPYAGETFLPGSGLFYGFRIPKGTEFEYFEATPSRPGRPETRTATAITLEQGQILVTLGFGNLKSADGTQLRPALVSKDDMKSRGFQDIESASGIFYDATLLPEGFNHFTVWMYVGKVEEKEKLLEYARKGVLFKASRVW